MSDVFYGQRSPTRFPTSSLSSPRSSPRLNDASPPRPSRAGSPCASPRCSTREAVNASNECLTWLKVCQSDDYAEEKVDDMICGEAKQALREKRGEILMMREELRNPTYRNATKCATRLAKASKPPLRWR